VDKGRLRSIVSALGHCELTFLERQFVGRVKDSFKENGMLTDQQESILEGIYREKIRWMKKGLTPAARSPYSKV
jgi:hypothetical protein